LQGCQDIGQNSTLRSKNVQLGASLAGRHHFEGQSDIGYVGGKGFFRIELHGRSYLFRIAELAVDAVLHEHRTIQRDCDFGKLQLPLVAASHDKACERPYVGLVRLFDGNGETAHNVSVLSL